MDGVVIEGVLKVVGISLVVPGLFFVALHLGEARCWWRERRRPVAPVVRLAGAVPLEQLVARLRRLHPEVHAPRPGTPMAKHLGAVMAYDDALVAVVRALGADTSLPRHDLGTFEREVERLRVEHLLTEAGVRLRPAA